MDFQHELQQCLSAAIKLLQTQGLIPEAVYSPVRIVANQQSERGDYSTVVALQLAKGVDVDARELAFAIVKQMQVTSSCSGEYTGNSDDAQLSTFSSASEGIMACVKKCVVSGPGYINFYLYPAKKALLVASILSQAQHYGVVPIKSILANEYAIKKNATVRWQIACVVHDDAALKEAPQCQALTDLRCAVFADTLKEMLKVCHVEQIRLSFCNLFELIENKPAINSNLSLENNLTVQHLLQSIGINAEPFYSEITSHEKLLLVLPMQYKIKKNRILQLFNDCGYAVKDIHFVFINQASIEYTSSEYLKSKNTHNIKQGNGIELVTEIIDNMGLDATRSLFLARQSAQAVHIRSNVTQVQHVLSDVQFAHARLCSVLRQCQQRGFVIQEARGLSQLTLLWQAEDQALLAQLAIYPQVLANAVSHFEPQYLIMYLRHLAIELHSYYLAQVVWVEEEALRQARLCLLLAARQVIVNGLSFFKVSIPEVM